MAKADGDFEKGPLAG